MMKERMTVEEQLIEGITQDILAFLMEEKGLDWTEGMHLFFLSETYEKLSDIETGLYRESSSYIFDIFSEELENGKIIQSEV